MRHLLPLCLLLTGTPSFAQKAQRLLPFLVDVTENGQRAEGFSVIIFKDNEQVAQLPPSEHHAFELALDLNAYFNIRISKEGCREKVISVDTHVPDAGRKQKDLVYTVDLEPADRYAQADPFYLDFPSAVVRWNDADGDFAHSEHYLADIRTKVTPSSAQAGPR